MESEDLEKVPVNVMYNKNTKPFVLIHWRVELNQCITGSSSLLKYMYQEDYERYKHDLEMKVNINTAQEKYEKVMRSDFRGIISRLLVKEGDVVTPGMALLEFVPCSHELILKGVCTLCGKDTWSANTIRNFEGTGLHLTQEQAYQLKCTGENILLREKKLALGIYVDEILFQKKQYSECVNNDPEMQQAETSSPCCEICPNMAPFLKSISKQYEVHYITREGENIRESLARSLKKILGFSPHVWTSADFEHRKLDEDELKVIFPHGHTMALAIDCQESKFPNVIYVKSNYSFYEHRETLNVAESLNAKKHPSESQPTTSSSDPPESTTTKQEGFLLQDLPDINRFLKTVGSKCINSSHYRKNIYTYPSYLKRVLSGIHRDYYSMLNQMIDKRMFVVHHRVIPDITYVIPHVWHNILNNVNLTFSGLFPTNVNAEKCPHWILAVALGAHVTKDIVLNNKLQTTHVIAHQLGTRKVCVAKSKKMFVLTIDWLYYCAFYWARCDEKQFLLDRTSDDNEFHILKTEHASETSSSPNEPSTSATTDSSLPSTSGCSTLWNISPQKKSSESEEFDDYDYEANNSDYFEEDGGTRKRKKHCSVSYYYKKQKKLDPNLSDSSDEYSSSPPRWDKFLYSENSSSDESDNDMDDYIYSEDEDPFLRSSADSDFSDD